MLGEKTLEEIIAEQEAAGERKPEENRGEEAPDPRNELPHTEDEVNYEERRRMAQQRTQQRLKEARKKLEEAGQ